MRRMQMIFGVLLSVAMLVGSATDRSATAQEDASSFTIEATGEVILVQEPWKGEVGRDSAVNGNENLRFVGTNDTLLLGFLPVDAASGDPIGDFWGSMAGTVGPITDIERGGTYALQASVTNGVPYGHFSLVFDDRTPDVIEIVSYTSPVSTFAGGLETLRESVTIGGKPIFEGVDAVSLQTLLMDTIGSGDPTSDTALAPVLVNPDVGVPAGEGHVSSDVRPGARLIAAFIIKSGIIGDFGELGGTDVSVQEEIVDANMWVSPTFGTEVTWSDEWTLAPDMASPGSGGDGSEVVQLVRKDGSGLEFSVAVSPVSSDSIDSAIDQMSYAIPLSPINTIALAESVGSAGGVIWHDPHWVFAADFSTSHDGSTMIMGYMKAPLNRPKWPMTASTGVSRSMADRLSHI